MQIRAEGEKIGELLARKMSNPVTEGEESGD
jgi:hypothetical protein